MSAADLPMGTRTVEPVLDTAAAAHASLVNSGRATLVRFGTAVTVSPLAEATSRSDETVRRWVARKRDAGRLIVVRLHDGTQLIPTVQFDAAFKLDERVADRTQRLVEWGMGPWAVWDWWQTPNGWLPGEHSPAGRPLSDHQLKRAVTDPVLEAGVALINGRVVRRTIDPSHWLRRQGSTITRLAEDD